MSEEIIIEKNLVYGQSDRENLTADVYRPIVGDELPVVFLLHGGAFHSGSKEMYRDWGKFLARNGFISIAINYRLATPTYSTWPGVLEDIQTAINWGISHANEWDAEPQRLAFVGDSAGAYLATQFSLLYETNTSFNIRAVVGVYGVYDLEKEWEHSPEMLKKLFGTTYEEYPLIYKQASPVNLIESAVSSPVFDTSYFVIWGAKDNIARPFHSELLVEKFQQHNIDTKTYIVPDRGHFWFNLIPGIEGGTVEDYPNNELAPKIVTFLREACSKQRIGHFSQARIEALKKLYEK